MKLLNKASKKLKFNKKHIKYNLKNKGSRINIKGKILSSDLDSIISRNVETPQQITNKGMFNGNKRMIIFHQSESGRANTIQSKPISLKKTFNN
mmetsp:Transcript_11889/g.10506  ORF Transcript_11889/g.10506 Transcript_11889/m.10506 type:complete len:94 (+) Transcript_11889:855-1136(+)